MRISKPSRLFGKPETTSSCPWEGGRNSLEGERLELIGEVDQEVDTWKENFTASRVRRQSWMEQDSPGDQTPESCSAKPRSQDRP